MKNEKKQRSVIETSETLVKSLSPSSELFYTSVIYLLSKFNCFNIRQFIHKLF